MKARDKLRAYWSHRSKDLILDAPRGRTTKSDAHYLAHSLGAIVDELERRGYDPKTIKFSIEPQQGNERFASQREEDST